MAILELVRACSPRSLGQRFLLSTAPDPMEVLARYGRYLRAHPPHRLATAAFVDRTPVGLLNVTVTGCGQAEVAVLVADAWQRRGVASTLIAGRFGHGDWAGWTVRAVVHPHNESAIGLLRAQHISAPRLVEIDPGGLEFDIAIPQPRAARPRGAAPPVLDDPSRQAQPADRRQGLWSKHRVGATGR